MPTYYLDLENGDDTKDGLSFANRWKTFAGGATSARLAAGDTIRIMASPAPSVLTGVRATWTQDSSQVVLDTKVAQNICECETAWTAANANVTCGKETNIGFYKEGTGSARFVVAAAFTTGKAAHYTLPAALNLSSLRYVTFWIRTDTNVAANALSLRLCSDTAGNTSVATIPLNVVSKAGGNHGLYSGTWMPLTIDPGANLPATVQSVALYVDTDLSTTVQVTIWLDNIMACNIITSNPFGLNSLIGMDQSTGAGGDDSDTWYPIKCISTDGQTITLDRNVNSNANAYTKYAGPTRSNIYFRWRNPVIVNCFASSITYHLQNTKNGLDGSPITYSFGWNRTDMSTQTDETWIDGVNGMGYGIYSNFAWNVFERIGAVRCYHGTYLGTNNLTCRRCHASANTAYGAYIGVDGDFEFIGVNGNGNYGIYGGSCRQKASFKSCCSNSSGGVQAFAGTLYGGIAAHNQQSGVALAQQAIAYGVTTRGNSYGVSIGTNSPNGPIVLLGCDLGEASNEFSILSAGYNYRVHSRNHDKTPGYNVIWTDGGKIETDTTVTRTGSGKSWKLSVTSTSRRAAYPLDLRLAVLACKANQPVTVSTWVRRSSTAINVQLCARADLVPTFVEGESVVATAAGAANTWEKLTVTFTPSEDGPVDLWVYAWGGSTYYAWVDDFEASGGLATASDLASLDWDQRGGPMGPSHVSGGGTTIIVIDD